MTSRFFAGSLLFVAKIRESGLHHRVPLVEMLRMIYFFDLKSSLMKFDLRSRSRDVPGVTKGVMLHIIRRALTRLTYWCFLFCDIFIVSIVIGKRSLGLKSVFFDKKGFFKELSGQLDKFKK